MIHTFIIVLLINLTIVLLTDFCGANSFMKKVVSFIATKGKMVTDQYECQILDCSLCQTFWVTLIYILIAQPCMWWVVPISAYCTRYTNAILTMVDAVIIKVLDAIEKLTY